MSTNKERIESTSKRDQKIARNAAVSAYQHRAWTYRNLDEAYGKASCAKYRAWNYCVELCEKMSGFDMLISSKNTMVFSVVFKFYDEDGNLGYAYITRDYDRFCNA